MNDADAILVVVLEGLLPYVFIARNVVEVCRRVSRCWILVSGIAKLLQRQAECCIERYPQMNTGSIRELRMLPRHVRFYKRGHTAQKYRPGRLQVSCALLYGLREVLVISRVIADSA